MEMVAQMKMKEDQKELILIVSFLEYLQMQSKVSSILISQQTMSITVRGTLNWRRQNKIDVFSWELKTLDPPAQHKAAVPQASIIQENSFNVQGLKIQGCANRDIRFLNNFGYFYKATVISNNGTVTFQLFEKDNGVLLAQLSGNGAPIPGTAKSQRLTIPQNI